jgi:hypothetical protein
MEKRQRDIVMIVVTLTFLSFVPIVLGAYAGYDMTQWRVWTFPATFVVINALLLFSAFRKKKK